MERTIRVTEIRVRYRVALPADKKEVVERVLQAHPAACPAHESVKDAIRVQIGADIDWK